MHGKRLSFFALSDKYEISCSLTIKYQAFRTLDASCSGLTVNKAYDRSRAVVSTGVENGRDQELSLNCACT